MSYQSLLLLAVLVIGAGIWVRRVQASPVPSRSAQRRLSDDKCSVAVFLGSGGHTSEMLGLLQTLDFECYKPRTYIISEGDHLSESKVKALELLKQGKNAVSCSIVYLPRARRVHQSFLSTPPTFLRSLASAWLLIFLQPAVQRKKFADVIILNGPGTCVSVCLSAYFSKLFGLPSPKTLYVESFARVSSLSLSGKLLRPFVDQFIVQWPQLSKKSQGTKHYGWLI